MCGTLGLAHVKHGVRIVGRRLSGKQSAEESRAGGGFMAIPAPDPEASYPAASYLAASCPLATGRFAMGHHVDLGRHARCGIGAGMVVVGPHDADRRWFARDARRCMGRTGIATRAIEARRSGFLRLVDRSASR